MKITSPTLVAVDARESMRIADRCGLAVRHREISIAHAWHEHRQDLLDRERAPKFRVVVPVAHDRMQVEESSLEGAKRQRPIR